MRFTWIALCLLAWPAWAGYNEPVSQPQLGLPDCRNPNYHLANDNYNEVITCVPNNYGTPALSLPSLNSPILMSPGTNLLYSTARVKSPRSRLTGK